MELPKMCKAPGRLLGSGIHHTQDRLWPSSLRLREGQLLSWTSVFPATKQDASGGPQLLRAFGRLRRLEGRPPGPPSTDRGGGPWGRWERGQEPGQSGGKSFQFPCPRLPRPQALIKPLHSAPGRGAGGSLNQAGEAAAGGSRLGEGQPSV